MLPPSPFVLVLYILGVVFSVPSFKILWNTAAYVIGSRNKLDAVADDVDTLKTNLNRFIEESRRDREERRQREQMYEIGLTLVETDINALQHITHVPVREYPFRRFGE
jgi:hypothetical protein